MPLFQRGVWFWLLSQGWPSQKTILKNEAQALFLAEKIRDFFDCELGLGVWVEGKPGEQILSMALAGKKRGTFSHRIGGFAESLPDRVAVMALDWLRKQLLTGFVKSPHIFRHSHGNGNSAFCKCDYVWPGFPPARE